MENDSHYGNASPENHLLVHCQEKSTITIKASYCRGTIVMASNSKIDWFINLIVLQFRPILDTPEALKHTHHFIVHKCRAPAGSTDEEYFERFIDQPGDNCYLGSRDVPMSDCESYLFLWAVGGKVTTIYIGFTNYTLSDCAIFCIMFMIRF